MTRRVDISRALSHALRHEPGLYEMELDDHGWVALDEVVNALRREPGWSSLTANDVETTLATANRQRHEIHNGRIRASYGHSVPGRIDRVPAAPPRTLFHGTSPEAARVIAAQGLAPMGRQFVHLSADRETAYAMGSRKADVPSILAIAAGDAAAAGVSFYRGNDKVWLADEVPAHFIR